MRDVCRCWNDVGIDRFVPDYIFVPVWSLHSHFGSIRSICLSKLQPLFFLEVRGHPDRQVRKPNQPASELRYHELFHFMSFFNVCVGSNGKQYEGPAILMSCISFVQFVLGPGSRKSWRVSSSTERGKAEGGGFRTFWTCSWLWLARSVSLSIEDLVAILCYSWKIWSCTILVPGTQFVFGLVIWRWFGGVYIISEHRTSVLKCRLFADVSFATHITS